MSGKKFDQDKPDLSLIPKIALDETAKAFMVGEKKYGRYNYCEGMEASRIVGAMLRHAAAWFEGNEYDPTDGQHHLGSVIACASMILRMQELNTLIDNRFKIRVPVTNVFNGPNNSKEVEQDGFITEVPKL